MTRPSRRKAWLYALTLLVPFALALALVELGLRVAARARGEIRDERTLAARLEESRAVEVGVVETGNLKGLVQPSEPDIVYELKPNRRWLFRGALTETNRQGYRGRDFAPRPDGGLRVIGLGDSVMFGWGVALEDTYLFLLERRLAGAFAPRPVDVLNFAVPGYNSLQEAAVFEKRVLPHAPDVVLLNYSVNDWAGPFFVDDTRGGLVAESELLRFVRRRLRPEAEAYLDSLKGHDKVEQALASIGRQARARGLPVIFFIYPQPGDVSAVRALARREGFREVDLHAAFDAHLARRGLAAEQLYVRPDDPHPNAEGHRLIADTLEPALRAALAERPTAPVTRR